MIGDLGVGPLKPMSAERRVARVRRSLHSDFMRHNAVMFAGNAAIAALNYAYYPILTRTISTAAFGEVQAVISFFLLATLFLGVLSDVTTNVVTNEADERIRAETVAQFERLATAGTVVLVAAGLVLVGPLSRFLHFRSTAPFVLLGVALVITTSVTLRSAYLRGIRDFRSLSIAGTITAGLKLLGGASLVLLGFGSTGAVGGLVVAQVCCLVYVRRSARRRGLRRATPGRWLSGSRLRPHAGYSLLVLAVSIVTTLLFSSDVVVAKHYFAPQTAGLYAGVAAIARIVYFLTDSIGTVLLSSVKMGPAGHTNRAVLHRSVALFFLLSGSVTIVFCAAPRLVVRILLGGRYEALSWLLPRLSVALLLLSLLSLVLSYDLALRRWSAAVVGALGVVAMAAMLVAHHTAPVDIADSLLGGALVMLAARALDAARRYRRAKVAETA